MVTRYWDTSPIHFRQFFCRPILFAISVGFAFSCPEHVQATDRIWSGGSGTDWATGGNWTGGSKPAAGDNAKFSTSFTNQPNVAGNNSLAGIWMTSGVGQDVTISGTGTLQLAGGTINGTANLGILIDNPNAVKLTINAGIQLSGAQTWRNNSSNVFTVGGGVNIFNKALTIDGTGDTTLSGLIQNGGAFTKGGAGTLTLSNTSNSFTGQLTVQAGTLSIDTINNISSAGELGNSALSVILGNSGTTGTLEYSGATASSTKTFTLATSGTGAFQIDGSGTTLTLSGAIDGSGGLTKTGAGTLALNATETYSGTTTVSAGKLQLSASDRISSSSALTLSGGTFDLQGFNETVAAVTLTSGSITGTGTATLTGTSYAMQSGTVSAILAGAVALTKTTSGTVTLSGANTYSGGTYINGGTLSLGSSGALGSSGTISFGGGTLQHSSSNTTDYSNRFSTAASQAYSVDTNGQNVTWATALTSSSGTLAKTGSGTLTLSGANTFNGTTTVGGGTLTAAAVSGSALASTSSITVNSGGTLLLGASDQINNSATMTLNGGTFSKGNFSEGTTAAVGIGALTLSASSHIDFGTGTVGVLSFASLNPAGFTLTIDNWTGSYNTIGNASSDRLIFDSDQTGNLSNFSFTGFGAGTAVQFNLGGGFYEVVAAVPEPSTIIPGALAFTMLGIWHIRRCRRGLAAHVAKRPR